MEENLVPDVQFVPINFEKDGNWYKYYLLFFLKSRFDIIDFSVTDICIMRSVWDVEKVVRVRDIEEFFVLLKEVSYPRVVLIENPIIKPNAGVDLCSIEKTCNGIGFFISKKMKSIFEREGVSGWQYIPLAKT